MQIAPTQQWKHGNYTTETERGSLLEDGADGRCQIKVSHMLQGSLCYDMRPSCIFKCFNKEVLWPFQANPAFGPHHWHQTMKTTFLQLCWASVRFCTHIKQTATDYFPAACLLWLIKCLVILFQSVSDWLVLSYIPCSVCTLENFVCNLRLPTTCWLFLFTLWRQCEATLTFYGSADGKDLKIVIFFRPHSSNTHQGFVNYPWSEILDRMLVKAGLVKPSFSQPSPTFDLSSNRAKVSVSSL